MNTNRVDEEAPKETQQNDATESQAEETKNKDENKGNSVKSRKKSKKSKETEYKEKAEELNDKYLRLYSEFDNYRRRTSKEKLDLLKTASEELIIELLPVLDDFERALKSAEETKDSDAVKEGMSLIYNKFNGILTKKGLKAIEATDQEFNTDYHEAISYIPAPTETAKGKVIDAVEKGYTLHDKVIRYSKVVIGQ